MYGGASSKLSRVGGGGRGGKRNSFPPPPPQRPSAPSGGRLSLGSSGGPRNRSSNTDSGAAAPAAAAKSATNSSTEETFSLVTGNNPLAFAMIIRLAPDLIDEIKRVEGQGGTARMKFDSNANNTSGNVINVGGKDFRFTWSREMGDLCDIYEERQSGEDGNGLLVESGCAWRKVNVQRILDESTTNHVKMRSEEAERKLKSRKAIVLDHGNPSMKNQMKALAAAETNPWRTPFKKKEPPFKKRKVEPPQVGGPRKPPAYKSGLSSAAAVKGRHSASPLPSPPEQAAPASPFGAGIVTKSHSSVDDVVPIQVTSKENNASSEKEFPSRATSAARGTPGSKGKIGATPMDLQSMLITLLTENPKGMSYKALEKAVGDVIPNSVKKIEPIIKKIAIFQAPGRYLLKQDIDLESSKKPLSESESSPEDNHHQIPASEDKHDHTFVLEPSLVEKIPTNEYQEEAKLDSRLGEESSMVQKIDIQQHSPDLFGDKRVSDNSEGQAGSSSNSGSDSDSESDSSDSDSGSRSRSRSPVGSGSGSSSESDSDASSNSKEASDEDVDIMTSEDDKETKDKLEVPEPGLFVSPFPGRTDGVPVQNEIDERQDGLGSGVVEIEKILPDDDQDTQMAIVTSPVPIKESTKPAAEIKPYPPNHDEYLERQNFIGSLFDEKENMAKDGFRQEQSDSSDRIFKGKSKRGSDSKYIDEQSGRDKRLKSGNLPQAPPSGVRDSQFPEVPCNLSPDRVNDDSWKGSYTINRSDKDGNAEFGLQKGFIQANPVKPIPDARSSEHGGRAKAPDLAERPGKHVESLGRGPKSSDRSAQSFPMQKDKAFREARDEDTYTNNKRGPRNLKEGGFGSRHSVPPDSQYRKHGEAVGKFKGAGQVSNSDMRSSPKDGNKTGLDRSPVVNGKGSLLRRELSDLELGELREPVPDETQGVKKQFERKGSFKQSESIARMSDTWNSDASKVKTVEKVTRDLGKLSPPNVISVVPSNSDAVSKKRTPEHNVEDVTRPQHRVVQSQPLHLSRVDHTEIGSQPNRSADLSSKFRHNESGITQGITLEGSVEIHKKASDSEMRQNEFKRGPHSKRESRMRPSNTVADLTNGQKETTLLEHNNGVHKRRDSSSDENSSYTKYEKDEPELKGPIKDFSQYKEYVQEYRDKYESYCSLNKILETYRNEFQKMGTDLEFAEGRDMERYYNILGQLKDSYRQCGTRHKRLKKIFVVLHEELKTLKQRIKDFAHSYAKG